jgi:two-component system OmpR family response regulator
MVKPVDLNELVLRVSALLRRANIANDRKLVVGALVLDADEMTASLNGEEIQITLREFNILYKMLSYPKHTFSRAKLMDEFWGIVHLADVLQVRYAYKGDNFHLEYD